MEVDTRSLQAPPPRRSSSRSKRSTTNLSNLRLAPLSNPSSAITNPSDTGNAAYANYHSSYIQGKSAPTTPGILSHSSSRRHLHGGLSRKLSIYDQPSVYYAVEVNDQGVPRSGLRLDTQGLGPKAKSEAALLVAQRPTPRHPHYQTAAGHREPGKFDAGRKRHHHRSRTNPRHPNEEDDWLTRAGLATSTLLAESKGQSWLSTRSSSTSLVPADPDTSSSDEEELAYASLASSRHLALADDESSPLSPRVGRWGSRFGSRAASARTSRRGSRAALSRTPLADADAVALPSSGYFSAGAAGYGGGRGGDGEALLTPRMLEPDFVDVHEDEEGLDAGEGAEADVRRWAAERGGALGGLVERLVGWTLFSVDEDREESEVEDDAVEGADGGEIASGAEGDELRTEVDGRAGLEKMLERDRDRDSAEERDGGNEEDEEGEGGWRDAAWLLSVASKVLF